MTYTSKDTLNIIIRVLSNEGKISNETANLILTGVKNMRDEVDESAIKAFKYFVKGIIYTTVPAASALAEEIGKAI